MMRRTRALWLATAALLALCGASAAQDQDKDAKGKAQGLAPAKPRPGLEGAILAYHKGMTSARKADRVAALKAILPTRKDVEALLPGRAEALWPQIEASHKEILAQVDAIAREASWGGELVSIDVKDVRQAPAPAVKPALDLIPADVPVYTDVIRRRKRTSGGGIYLLVNGHWVACPWFETLPQLLAEAGKGPVKG